MWYIDRGGGALPREAADLLQALDPVLPSYRMRVRRRGVRSDDADRPRHESPPQHPLLEAVFFVTAVHLCRAPSEFSTYGKAPWHAGASLSRNIHEVIPGRRTLLTHYKRAPLSE